MTTTEWSKRENALDLPPDLLLGEHVHGHVLGGHEPRRVGLVEVEPDELPLQVAEGVGPIPERGVRDPVFPRVAVDGEARCPELLDDLHPLSVGVMLLCHEKSLRGCAEGVWTRTHFGGRVLISDLYRDHTFPTLYEGESKKPRPIFTVEAFNGRLVAEGGLEPSTYRV